MLMNRIIIFSQFPSDLRYTLWLYEKYKGKCSISIYVVNVYNSYTFLKNLDLKHCVINFIPYISNVRSPVGVIREKIRLYKFYKKYFEKIENCKIYFFSYYFDYITSYFIRKLSHFNKVFLFDFLDVRREEAKRVGFRNFLELLALYFLTGVPFIYTKQFNDNILTFPYKRYDIKKIYPTVDFSLIDSYLYKLNMNKKKNVLFFESNGIKDGYFTGYRETLTRILSDILKYNYDVYLKPHPRKSYSRFVREFNIKFIKEYIPAELIETEEMSFIFGIESTSIASVSIGKNRKVIVYSLIDLFNFTDSSIKHTFKEYLKNVSDGKLKFIKGYNDFLEILRSF